MQAFIHPPKRIPFFIRIGMWIARRQTGMDLLVPRLLAWHPPTAFSSGVLEGLVEHGHKNLDPRILQLVRMQTSLAVSCPFCIDMNSFRHDELGIEPELVEMMQTQSDPSLQNRLSEREQLALLYARQISSTPIQVAPDLAETMTRHFTEKELVILAATVAQVNYWARLIQGLGVPPAGFSDQSDACVMRNNRQ